MIASLDHLQLGIQRPGGGYGTVGIVIAAAIDKGWSRYSPEVEHII
jgi:hypothetical protein